MTFEYRLHASVTAQEVADLFIRSGINRPTSDLDRSQKMLDHANLTILKETVRFYEPNISLLDHLDEEFYVKLKDAVVGFEIEITVMEGKAKLSQNKSLDTIRGVINGLRKSDGCPAGEVAKLMQIQLDAIEGND